MRRVRTVSIGTAEPRGMTRKRKDREDGSRTCSAAAAGSGNQEFSSSQDSFGREGLISFPTNARTTVQPSLCP
jgi:hypothetical protein